jgi:hypothetical protein
LIALCEKTVWYRKDSIYYLFSNRCVAKADRVFTAKWLVGEFEQQFDPCGQVSMHLWELAVPQIADDLIRLIQDPRFGSNRSPLCMALTKTKHPRAAEVIASVIDQEFMAWAALQALAKLKAAQYAEIVRKFLRHPDSDVRRQAKKALKKFGFPVEKPVAPVHLVKGRRSLPRGLADWSANLDMVDLQPTLASLAKCVEAGFAETEIAEVIGVVEETPHNQTTVFCFPVTVGGQKSEVWISAFMDDIDSPDLEIRASPEVMVQLKQELPERE